MTVVLLTTNLARGGAEAQVAQLAMALHGRGWDVSVVSLLSPTAWDAELSRAGVPVFAPGIPRIPALLRRLRPHIVHCHMFHANVFGRLLRLILPFPVVISTIHSLKETSRGSRHIRGRDLLYRATDRLADVTVAVATAVADRHIAAHAVSPARVRVIPNGIDTNVFHPADTPRSPNAAFIWLATGRLIWKKDYPTLLKAFAHLSECVLWIAGAGPDEAELRRTAPPNVQFLGERADIPNLMRTADAFVMSSVVEGLPMALLEASASGLPCVATDAGGVRDVATARIVPPGDSDALAAAMQSVMQMPESERRRIGEPSRAYVCAHFDLKVITSAWEALYRLLC